MSWVCLQFPDDPFCGGRETTIKPIIKLKFDKRTKPEGVKVHEYSGNRRNEDKQRK